MHICVTQIMSHFIPRRNANSANYPPAMMIVFLKGILQYPITNSSIPKKTTSYSC